MGQETSGHAVGAVGTEIYIITKRGGFQEISFVCIYFGCNFVILSMYIVCSSSLSLSLSLPFLLLFLSINYIHTRRRLACYLVLSKSPLSTYNLRPPQKDVRARGDGVVDIRLDLVRDVSTEASAYDAVPPSIVVPIKLLANEICNCRVNVSRRDGQCEGCAGCGRWWRLW